MKVLEAEHISKSFPGVVALDDVSISFNLGEVHCIVGENGAGKSTLIRCLTNLCRPDEGRISFRGESSRKNKELFERVSYVPQEIDLFMNLSVAENLFIPYERSNVRGFINKKKIEKKSRPLLEKFGIGINPETLVKNISVSHQQLLQIARAMAFESYEILILDEPTTSLTNEDTDKLFEIFQKVKEENKTIVFVSHKLEEIFKIGDVITIMRNGKNVADVNVRDTEIPLVISQMTGLEIDKERTYSSNSVSKNIILKIENLTGEKFEDVNFHLYEGEILGLAGLVGAGRSELTQAIFGYLPIFSGEIFFKGEKWKQGNMNYSVDKGMFYLPEERRFQGILADLSIKENISIGILDQILKYFLISKKEESKIVEKIIDKYAIKTPNIGKEIKFLSGGNQQKVIISRALSCNPSVLIFDEPTKGIDVGAKAGIYAMMKEIAETRKIGIILISSEFDEVLKCSNRILTVYNGKITGEYQDITDRNMIMNSMLGLNFSEHK